MYGSWKTDISGTRVDSGAVVIGEKSTVPSWTCWPDLALAPERARVVVHHLGLAARQLGELVDELLGRQGGPVLGRIDIAHHQLLALGMSGGGAREGEDSQNQQSERGHGRASLGCGGR